MVHRVIVEDQSLRWYGRPPKIADNSVEFVQLQFHLPEEWASLLLVAQFTQSETYNMLITEDVCFLPVELKPGLCQVSLFGYSEGKPLRATSIPLVFQIEESGFVSSAETPIPPTPDLYAQLIEYFSSISGTGGVVDPAEIQKIVMEYLVANPPQVQETDPTVPEWAKYPTKPSYTAAEVGAVATVNGTSPDENGNVKIKVPDSVLLSILKADPAEPKEGQMWILKTATEELTTPVIEMGTVGENSIAIKLSNASFDGSGAVVATYNIYVNGELRKTENIEPGGTCTVDSLSPETEYQISVCGVKGTVLSEVSNVLTAVTKAQYVLTVGEGNCVACIGYKGNVVDGIHYLIDAGGNTRAVVVGTTGDVPFTNGEGVTGEYYPFPVPKDATSVTVQIPSGIRFSYNGYTVTDGQYERTLDSGFKNAGTTITFEAGKCQYCYFFFNKNNTEITEEDMDGITATFA